MAFGHHVHTNRTRSSLLIAAHTCLAITLIVLAQTSIHAQISVAVTGGAHLTSSGSTFTQLEGVPSPGPLTFSSSTSRLGGHFAAQADVHVVSLLSAGLRVSAGVWSTPFTATERQPIATPDGDVYLATLTHEFDGRITLFAPEPYVRVSPLPWLAFDLGIPFFFPLSSKYTQTVRFTDPPDLEFADGSIVQTTGSGDIPNLESAVPGLALRVEGSLPLERTGALRLVGQVGYERQLSSLVTVQNVTLQQVAFSLGLRYTFTSSSNDVAAMQFDTVRITDTAVVFSASARESIELAERVVTVDSTPGLTNNGRGVVTIRESYRHTMQQPPSVLQVSLTLGFVQLGGGETPSANLKIRRVRVETEHRYAPFIVFDEGASLPKRYTDPTAATHWHHGILRALESAMKKNSRSTVTLASHDIAQASAVQQELARRGIKSERVKTMRDASVERDMVRIIEASLLPVAITADTTIETVLPSVRIHPDVATDAEVASWQLEVRQRAAVVYFTSGEGMPPETITWDIAATMSADSALAAPFGVTLSITDHQGQTARSEEGKLELTTTAINEPGGTLHTDKRQGETVKVDGLNEKEMKLYK
jgi:hypothetical protein